MNELIEACKRNDADAFRKIYDTYAPKMMGISLRYMQNRAEAEDVLQDSFIKVYLNIKKYRSDGSFEGWLRRIVVNVAINKLKENARNEITLLDSDETIANNHIDESNSIEDIEYRYSMQEMLNAIQRLSNMHRMIFNMAEIEGFSTKEIAEKLNLSEHTIRGSLSKAKTILRTYLEKPIKKQR